MNRCGSVLLTDFYQLTMLQAYFDHGMEDVASFEFFSRRLPPNRGFMLAAGLEQVLEFLEGLRFTDEELEWVRQSGFFSGAFVDHLAALRFTGDVDAMPEGTAFFPDEPILRVTAPLPQAQLVESRVINLLHFQSLVATKAVRCVLAAPGSQLVDFGFRRAHGAEAGLLAARACYLAGFDGTATVLAAPLYGIPVFGTMAHSFIQAHENEIEALERFARSQPNNVVLLIDTYDTEAGAEKVVTLSQRLRKAGIDVKAVRLDSGDLAAHARKVRRILDTSGCRDVRIFASSSLDEYGLADLVAAGAPIDGFGVGTRLDVSSDAPYFDCAYKLVEYAGSPRRKRSEGKELWPGRKQVLRRLDSEGLMHGDTVVKTDEVHQGLPLLEAVMRKGQRTGPAESLSAIRERVSETLAALPESLKTLTEPGEYPVKISAGLRQLASKLDAGEQGSAP